MKAKLFLLLVAAVALGGAVWFGKARKEANLPFTPSVGVISEEEQTVAGTANVGADTSVKQITLSVSSPKSGATVRSANLAVRGKTKARAEVFVNDMETTADAVGNFSANLTLEEGENYILVVAIDEMGNAAEKELTVTYDPGQ